MKAVAPKRAVSLLGLAQIVYDLQKQLARIPDPAKAGNATASNVVLGNDTRLVDIRTPTTHNHTLSQITDAPTLAAGAYTPTLTNTTNLDASTAYQCQYLRVGATVTVSGRVDVDPTLTGAAAIGISLPVASNFGAVTDAAGSAFAPGIAGLGAAILADVVNDRLTMQWVAVDITNQPMYFSATYRVI